MLLSTILFPTIFFNASLVISVADGGVPTVDYVQSCRIESQQSSAPDPDFVACKRDEENARDKLRMQWSKYTATDKANCIPPTTQGYLPSYVELLTCVEMYVFLRQSANGTNPQTTPGGKSRRKR